MGKIIQDKSLKDLNAFRFNIKASKFTTISTIDDLNTLINNVDIKRGNFMVLGEGTNTLFTKDFDGLILEMDIKGIKKIKEDDNEVVLEIGAGENWIGLTEYVIKNNWGGIENLSYIPGKIGAAPVQNIAAYGQNFDEVFESLEAVNLLTGEIKIFDKDSCKFGYRTSIFKTKDYKKYVITSVKIRLLKNIKINTEYHSRYGSLLDELSKFTQPPYTIDDIHKAVVSIRKWKLPDWKELGTAGSFFINPVISKIKLLELQKIVPNVQFYPIDELTYPKSDDPKFIHSDYVKVAAGWLLEELGWKGKRIGDVGTSPNQALVLINYGSATPEDLINFTNEMKSDFYKKYGIKLESEVNIV